MKKIKPLGTAVQKTNVALSCCCATKTATKTAKISITTTNKRVKESISAEYM